MATKTLHLKDATASGSNHLSLQDGGTAPTTATTGTGWVVGTVTPTKYARQDSGTERASTALAAGAQPDGAPDNTLGDCWRSENTINGIFANANWSLSFSVIGVSRTTGTHDGCFRVRIWKSANADGSSASELTGSVQTTTQFTNLSNSVAQTLTVTWSPGATKELNNEYLFVQVALQLDGAGGNANCDVLNRVGANANITTSDFTANVEAKLTKTLANLTKTIQATAEVSATTSKTLANLTKDLKATAEVNGTSSKTLANATLESDTTVEAPGHTIVLAKTLANATLDGDATATVDASCQKTLGNATLESDGTAEVAASLSKTLAGTTLESDATAVVDASCQKTLANITSDSDAQLTADGSLAKTLGNVTLESDTTALSPVEAVVSKTLANASLESDVEIGNVHTLVLAKTLGNAALDSHATADVVGSASKTLGNTSLESDTLAQVGAAVDKALAGATLDCHTTVMEPGAGHKNPFQSPSINYSKFFTRSIRRRSWSNPVKA